MEFRLSKATTDALLRVALRSLPFLPAPELYDLIRSVDRSEKDLDRQIKESLESLNKSSLLIDSLELLLKERQARITALQAEYERTSQLATLTQEQAKAVATSLEGALGRAAVRERYISFAINIIAGLLLFIFGVFAADWVKGLASHLHR